MIKKYFQIETECNIIDLYDNEGYVKKIEYLLENMYNKKRFTKFLNTNLILFYLQLLYQTSA